MLRNQLLLRALIVFGLIAAVGWWWRKSGGGLDDGARAAASSATAAGQGSVVGAGGPASPVSSGAATVAGRVAPNSSALSTSLTRLAYAEGWDADLPPAFSAFREWTGRYLSAGSTPERVALEGEGLTLARARRVAMKQLIERDPRAALASTVPMAIRAQLPVTVLAELETRFSAVGDFSVLVFDYDPKELIRRKQRGLTTEPFQQFVQWSGGPELRAYVYGRREGQTTKNAIPLHGVQLDGVVALHESAVRVLESGETPAAAQPLTDLVSANPTASPTATLAEIGGRTFRFASPEEVVRADQKFAAAEAGIGPHQIPPIDGVLGVTATTKSTGTTRSADLPLPATAWTVGNKKMLVIRIDFSDLSGEPKRGSTTYTAAYVQNLTDTQVAPYYAQSSFGAASLTTTVTTQVYRMPQTASAYAVGNLNTQLHTDARNAAAANYTLSSYDRIFVLFSNLGGLAGSQITYGGLANVGGANAWSNGEWDFRVVAHELGHTWGLRHANLWKVADGNPVSTATSAASAEYGDDFDTMGANFANDQRTDFNPWFKNLLGWVNDSQVQTITSTGTYRVNRFDNATGAGTPLALKIVRDGTRSYWIGARRAFTTNASMQHGAYIVWGYGTNTQSNLLDLTTPGTSVSDAALAIGSTLLDTAGNVSIKLVSEGGSAPNEYIDVLVTVGLNGMPVISAHPASQGFAVGASVALSVTATASPTPAYQWRKYGADIAGATSATYPIANAQAYHAGTYTVQVSNTVATIVSNPATLSLNALPFIASQPDNITTTAGRTVTFGVVVTGFPVSTYQWRKASVNIAGATSATYAIANPQASHAGNYDVVITNALGTTTSTTASLTVNAAATPPSNDNFTNAWILPGNTGLALATNVGATGETGEPVHIAAGATASSVWFKWTPSVSGVAQIDTLGTSLDTTLVVYTGAALTALTKLKEDDDSGAPDGGGPSFLTMPVTAGTTYLLAVGSFDADPRGSITLNYKAVAPPTIATQPTNVASTLGGTATFTIVATGLGLTYQWFRNSVAIPGATFATLALENLQSSDAGSYYVAVANLGGGVISNTVALTVTVPPPTITTQPVNVAVTSGQNAIFSVTATGTGSLAYQWRRNGLAISAATSATYTKTGVTRAAADYYDVIVSSGTQPTTSQTVRLSVAPTSYPGRVAPDPAYSIRVEAGAAWVNQMIVAPDGRVYVGGEFVSVDGVVTSGVARLTTDLTVDPSFAAPLFEGAVTGIALQPDGKIVAVGTFVRVAGQEGSYVARLNADGSLDSTFVFHSVSSFIGGAQAVVLLPDGQMLIGGSGGVLRVNSDGTRDATFYSGFIGFVGVIRPLASGKILIGGRFSSIDGVARARVARLNADGTLDATFGTAQGLDGDVTSLVPLAGGKILVGGSFTSFDGTAVSPCVRLTADGTLDASFAAGDTRYAGPSVDAISVLGSGKILVGGRGAGATGSGLARLNADGSLDALLASPAQRYVGSFVGPGWVTSIGSLADGTALVGGAFSHLGGSGREVIARLNADGSLAAPVTTEISRRGIVQTLRPDALGRVVVGGLFRKINGVAAPSLARLNADGSVDGTFAFPDGMIGIVDEVLPLADENFLVRGSYMSAAGTYSYLLLRIGANGVRDTSFGSDPVAGSTLTSIAVASGGRVIAGGSFRAVDGTYNRKVLRLNSDGAPDTSFVSGNGTNAGGWIDAVLVQTNGKIVVAGSFDTFSGIARKNLVRLNSDGSVDSAFQTASAVEPIAFQRPRLTTNGTLVVYGWFRNADSSRSDVITLLQADGSLAAGYTPQRDFFSNGLNGLEVQENGGILAWQYQELYWDPFGINRNEARIVRLKNYGLADDGAIDPTFQFAGLRPTDRFTALAMGEDGRLFYAMTTGVLSRTTVATSSVITANPVAQIINTGSTATFTVGGSGAPAPTYQWQCQAAGTTGFVNVTNGGAYAGATTATLTIAPATVAMRGDQFQCLVSNGVGSPVVSLPATLTVNAPPAITSANHATFTATQPGAFTVVATGAPPPTFTVTGGTLPSWASLDSATGVLAGTPPNTAGSPFAFTLTVSNGIAPAATQSFVLAVLPVPVAPTITTPPVGQVVAAGATITLSVVATGTPVPSYQWRRNTADIAGATNATYTRTGAQLADAGSYTVFVSNSAGNVTSTPVTISVIPTGTSAQHAIRRGGYTAGGTVTIASTLTYSGAATGVSWQVLVPAGWSFASSTGDTAAVKPLAGAVNLADWTWATPPASPITFTYTLNVPAGTTGSVSLVASATVLQSGATIPLLAQPDPLAISSAATRHAADSDGDGKIGLFELTRVIELYNVRLGTTRTGAYKVDATSEDGFATDPTRSGTAALVPFHTADTNRDAQFSLIELTRVIELFNTRSGTTRTGAHHVSAGSEDGFAPGP